MRSRLPALALLASLLASSAGDAQAQGGGAVLCERGERWVVESRDDCLQRGGRPRLEPPADELPPPAAPAPPPAGQEPAPSAPSETCPAPGPGQPASRFASVQLVSWTPFLAREGSHHPDDDGESRDRCALVRVCYKGSGSRLVEAADFVARLASGAQRQGAHFSGGGVRLQDGQFATGAVCFGGARRDPIAALELR
jgi:hypothetical protein